MKRFGAKLIPFVLTVSLRFLMYDDYEEADPSHTYCILKCLPVASLIYYTYSYTTDLSGGKGFTYSRCVTIGLVAGIVGDALLVWPNYFVHGMTAFAIGHMFYTYAFGFSPVCYVAAAVFLALTSTAILLVWTILESGIMAVFVPVYIALLCTMGWRAVAPFTLSPWSWSIFYRSTGALLFIVSDALIGINKFALTIPYAPCYIAVTYFLAQLAMSLSVVDSQVEGNQTKGEKEM